MWTFDSAPDRDGMVEWNCWWKDSPQRFVSESAKGKMIIAESFGQNTPGESSQVMVNGAEGM